MGIRSLPRVDGTFSFCERSGLVAYTRNIDPDSDYIPTIEARDQRMDSLAVSIRRLPRPGPGGGDVQDVVMQWKQGSTEIEVTFSPEGRDGAGNS